MAVEWREMTLGEFVSLQRGHDLTEEERSVGSVPVMGSAGMNGTHGESKVKGPGIVIGRSGASFGQVHYIDVDYWPHNTALYVTDFHGNDPRFVYYFLRSLDFTRYNSGSAQPSLNRNFLYPIEIVVPNIEEQRAIAHILGALDDKIELNHRTNATLEAIACALFKSWFVDFDGIAPEDMQESELGLIPKGWRVGTLADLCELKYGKALKATKRREGEIPVYGSGGVTGYHDEALVIKPTIIVGRKGTVGSLYWLNTPCFPIDTVFYVEPKVSLNFCYYAMTRMGLHNLNTDAAVPG
ncbi:MAG: restriction endonuclease subunit S, partial [Azoarcus sp.]|nr:restriction endonuclease subunit S [Azoarcus sp.]